MESATVQILLFKHIKGLLPSHISLVDEIAGVLNISTDSAYRRIRGEKPIDLEEAKMLCCHFKVSLDQLLHLKNDAFIFTGALNNKPDNRLEEWLENIQKQFQWVNSFNKKHVFFLIKDIPPILHFQIPELAAFKFFFWMKSLFNYDSLKGVKFNFNDSRYDKYYTICKNIIELYNRLPTTEIWNIESVNTTLRQIQFHWESGSFTSIEDVKVLLFKVEELINHIQQQAELGVKFGIGQSPESKSSEYRLLVNELIMGDNTFMAEVGNIRYTFLNHSVLEFIGTHDEKFNDAMFNNLNNLINKSTLISTVGEKERNQFFNRIRQKISNRVKLL